MKRLVLIGMLCALWGPTALTDAGSASAEMTEAQREFLTTDEAACREASTPELVEECLRRVRAEDKEEREQEREEEGREIGERPSQPWYERCNRLPPDQIEACFNRHNGEGPASKEVQMAFTCAHDEFAIEPRRIGVSCDSTFLLYGLHWRHWGKATATAIGRARLQGCEPFCADGVVTRPRVKLRATHIVIRDGERFYALLHYTLIGRMPYAGSHRGIVHMISKE